MQIQVSNAPGYVWYVQPSSEPTNRPTMCSQHNDVAALTFCQRCGEPICGDCMIEAPVGYQCPRCVASGQRRTRSDELPFGGRAHKGTRSTTSVIMGINAVIWVAILLTGGSSSLLVRLLALTPQGLCLAAQEGRYYAGVDASTCAALPGTTWAPGVADGAVWQVITSGFVHVDLLHILSNMLILWFIGPNLEQILGRSRFIAMYVLSLIGGSTVVMWLSGESTTSLGASGAIFGLLGALLILSIRTKGDIRGVLMWIGLNLVITVMGLGTISWQAHLGGLAAGLLATVIIVYTPGARQRRSLTQWILLGAFAALLAVAIGIRMLQIA